MEMDEDKGGWGSDQEGSAGPMKELGRLNNWCERSGVATG